jgi:hypothetical protein
MWRKLRHLADAAAAPHSQAVNRQRFKILDFNVNNTRKRRWSCSLAVLSPNNEFFRVLKRSFFGGERNVFFSFSLSAALGGGGGGGGGRG